MPWSVKDVDSHKKGLSPSQKRKWVRVANGVLKDCQASGGGKSCEGKAIRIANSQFEEDTDGRHMLKERKERKMKQKIPRSALALNQYGCFARVDGGEDDKAVKLDMTIYSGKIMKGHWWWGNLALDLDGMETPKSKYPILENHMSARKIGFSGKPLVTKDKSLKLDPDTVTFVETEESLEFQKLSRAGFPYESSLYGQPFSIERVEEGTSVDVNGYKFRGPGVLLSLLLTARTVPEIRKSLTLAIHSIEKQFGKEYPGEQYLAEMDIQGSLCLCVWD